MSPTQTSPIRWSSTQNSPTQMLSTQNLPTQMSLTANVSGWENLTSPLATTNWTSSPATTNLNHTWPPEVNVGYLTLFGVSGVLALSILGNGLVIVSFFRDVRLRVIFNLFVVHLATADVIMSFLVVLTLTDHVTHLSLLSHWPLLCQVFTVLAQAIPLEQVVVLHLVCHDRRRALRLGLSYSRHTGQWHVHKMLLVLTWVVTVVFSFLVADVMLTVEDFSYRSCSFQNRLVYIRYSSCLHLLLLAGLVVNVAYITWDFRERRRKGPEFEPLHSEWEQEPTFHVQFPKSRECPSRTECLSSPQGSTLGRYANRGQCPTDNKTGVMPPQRHPPLIPRAALAEDFECNTHLSASTRTFRGVVQMMLSTHRPGHRRQSQSSLDGPSRLLVDTNNHRNCLPRKSAIFEHVTETAASRRYDQEMAIMTTSTATRVAENPESTDESKTPVQPKENSRKASASFSEGALTVQGRTSEESTRFSLYPHPSGSPRMGRYSVSRRGHNRKTNDALKTRISSNLTKPSLSSPTCGCCRFSTEGGHDNRTIPPGSNEDKDDQKTSPSYCLRANDWVQYRDVFSTLNFDHHSVPHTVCKSYSCFGPDLTKKAGVETDVSTCQNFDPRRLSTSANDSRIRVSEYPGLVSEDGQVHRSASWDLKFKSIHPAASIDGGFSLLASSEVDVRHSAVLGASRVKSYLTCHSEFYSESSLLRWEPTKDVHVRHVSCLSSDFKHQTQPDGDAHLVMHPDPDSKEIVFQRDCTSIMATQSANTVLKSSQTESARVTISQADSPASIISHLDNTSVATCQPYTAANFASQAPSADCCTSQPDYPAIIIERATRPISTQLSQTDLPDSPGDFSQPPASVELVTSANYTNSDPEKAIPDPPLASSLSQPSPSQEDIYPEAAPCDTRDSEVNENNNGDSDESLSKSDSNNEGKLAKDAAVTGGRSTVLHDANHIGSFDESSEHLGICETVNAHSSSTQTGSSTRRSLALVLVDDKAKTSREWRTKNKKVFSLEFTPSNSESSLPQRRSFPGGLSDSSTTSDTFNTDLSQTDLEVARKNWLQFYDINAASISLPNKDSTPKSLFQNSTSSSSAEDSLAVARRIWLDFYGISNISDQDFSSRSSFPSQSAIESLPNGHLSTSSSSSRTHLSTELINTVPNIPQLLKAARSDTRSQNLEKLRETRDSTKRPLEDTEQHPGYSGLRSSQSAEFRIGKSHQTRLESVVGAMGKKLKMSSSAHGRSKTEQAQPPFNPARWPTPRSAPLKRISTATSKHCSDRKPSPFNTTQGDVLAEADMSKDTVTYLCGLLGHQLLDTAGQTSEQMASQNRNPDFHRDVSNQGNSGASHGDQGCKAGLALTSSSFQDLHTIRSLAQTQKRTRTPVSKQRDNKVTEDTGSLSDTLGTKDELGGLNRRLDAPERQSSFYCPNKLYSLDPISPVSFVCQESSCSSDKDGYNAHTLAGSLHPALHERKLQEVDSKTGLSHVFSPLASSVSQGYICNQDGSCEIQNPAITKDLAEGATGLKRRVEPPMRVDHEAAGCSPLHMVESWSVTSRALLVELGIYQDVLTGAIPLDLTSLARTETRCSVPPCPDCQKRAREHRQRWTARGLGLGPDGDEDGKSNRSNNALTDVFQQGMTIVCHQLPSSSCSSSSTMTAGDTSAEDSSQDSLQDSLPDSGQDSCLLVLPGFSHQVGGTTRDHQPIPSSGTQHKIFRPPKRWSCPYTSQHLWKVLSFEQLKKRDAELSILISLICLVLLQLLCWLPIAVTYLVYDITGFPSHVTASELSFLFVWCARMAIQPLLYAYYSAFFRQNYSQLVCCS